MPVARAPLTPHTSRRDANAERDGGSDVNRYSRVDALRILHLQARQLVGWERAGLIPSKDAYSFEELGRLRTLRDLRARRLSAKAIRASLEAMQRVAGVGNVLLEMSAVRRGSKLSFRFAGSLLEPLTQQLAFDFESSAGRSLAVTAGAGRALPGQTVDVQGMFLRAVAMEDSSEGASGAVELYEQILEIRPRHAPTLINLGTIYYNRKLFPMAEAMYRRATEADPEYALAFFDLGNVLDEMQRLPEATAAYQRAVSLVPQYADAHYNLALAYERQGERRRALRHWIAYSKLDPVGPWSAHARLQARKILKLEKLSIVSRRGRMVRAAG